MITSRRAELPSGINDYYVTWAQLGLFITRTPDAPKRRSSPSQARAPLNQAPFDFPAGNEGRLPPGCVRCTLAPSHPAGQGVVRNPERQFAQPRKRVVPLERLMDDRGADVAVHLLE